MYQLVEDKKFQSGRNVIDSKPDRFYTIKPIREALFLYRVRAWKINQLSKISDLKFGSSFMFSWVAECRENWKMRAAQTRIISALLTTCSNFQVWLETKGYDLQNYLSYENGPLLSLDLTICIRYTRTGMGVFIEKVIRWSCLLFSFGWTTTYQ